MKVPKETRQAINRMRSERGKKNGVIRWLCECTFIDLDMIQGDKKFKHRTMNRKQSQAAQYLQTVEKGLIVDERV